MRLNKLNPKLPFEDNFNQVLRITARTTASFGDDMITIAKYVEGKSETPSIPEDYNDYTYRS